MRARQVRSPLPPKSHWRSLRAGRRRCAARTPSPHLDPDDDEDEPDGKEDGESDEIVAENERIDGSGAGEESDDDDKRAQGPKERCKHSGQPPLEQLLFESDAQISRPSSPVGRFLSFGISKDGHSSSVMLCTLVRIRMGTTSRMRKGSAMPLESRGRSRIKSFVRSLSESLEMPQDVVLDVPRVTLIGNVQVQIGNHKGVLEYTPTRIRIRTRDGILVVEGKRLKIGSIFRDEVVVEGRIERLDLDAPRGNKEEGAP